MILVTGATGNVGRRLTDRLRADGRPVRAIGRAAADFLQPHSFVPHMSGVEAVFLIWPIADPAATALLAPRVLEALSSSGTPTVVYLSASAAATDPNSFWALVEQAVGASGLPWTFLRPTGFATNTLGWADQIRSGDTVRWPFGAAGRSLVHEDDIAAVAAAALTDPAHRGRTHVLTGPQSIAQKDQVRIIGEQLGRTLRWEEAAADEVRPALRAAWGNADLADTALAAWAAMVDNPEPVTDTVAEITGRPAKAYAEWVADHLADFAGGTHPQATR